MATLGVQPQAQAQYHPSHQQQRQPQQQHYQMERVYPNQSVMGDSDGDEEDSMEGAIDMDQAQYYQHQQQHQQQQQQQGTYYQYHQPQQDGRGDSADAGPSSRLATQDLITHGDMQEGLDEEEYSDEDDDDESTASIPDENIDFSLTYAL
jgi:hypothetical protein